MLLVVQRVLLVLPTMPPAAVRLLLCCAGAAVGCPQQGTGHRASKGGNALKYSPVTDINPPRGLGVNRHFNYLCLGSLQNEE